MHLNKIMQEEQYRKEEARFLNRYTNMSLPQTPSQSFEKETLENTTVLLSNVQCDCRL